MKKQLTEIWEYAQSIAKVEDGMPTPPDFTEINTEKVKAAVEKLNEVLNKNPETSQKAKQNSAISLKIILKILPNMKIRNKYWVIEIPTQKQTRMLLLCE